MRLTLTSLSIRSHICTHIMHEIVQYGVRQRKRENLHEDLILQEIRYELRQPEKGVWWSQGWNWVNCYHSYPAHAAFGGYKNSGIGRETHKMMLNHYQQTKNVLVSYAESPDGFF